MSKCDIIRSYKGEVDALINIKLSGEVIEEELKVYHTGYQQCSGGYYFGPFVRDHYLVHYIISGKGTYKMNNQTYYLSNNQAFFIFPGVKTYYKADYNEPWTYLWVGFHGDEVKERLKLTGITEKNPIINVPCHSDMKNIMEDMIVIKNKTYEERLRLKGLLYIFLAELVKIKGFKQRNTLNNISEIYLTQAVDYIEKNYSNGIGVEDIANYLGIDRSYFTRLFTKEAGYTPRHYLTEFRIKKSLHLLSNTMLTVADIARSVGYNDGFSFSKAFKRITNQTPTEYRKNCI